MQEGAWGVMECYLLNAALRFGCACRFSSLGVMCMRGQLSLMSIDRQSRRVLILWRDLVGVALKGSPRQNVRA